MKKSSYYNKVLPRNFSLLKRKPKKIRCIETDPDPDLVLDKVFVVEESSYASTNNSEISSYVRSSQQSSDSESLDIDIIILENSLKLKDLIVN